MTRDHLRDFLLDSLKQAWTPGDDIVMQQLQASKRELGKLRCLLPPQGEPSTGIQPDFPWVCPRLEGPGLAIRPQGLFSLFCVTLGLPLLLSSAPEASEHKAWLGLKQLADVLLRVEGGLGDGSPASLQ